MLGYDPIGQGERRQFWNPITRTNEIGGGSTWEHALPGQLLLLIGQDLLAEMLGVQRPTVSVTLRALQDAGLISQRRGAIR